jgi:ABC-type transporter Mla subunit MlaD
MKRIALILALFGSIAATVVAAAGASGDRTYQAELFNAFGLVKGSELRVAGVKAGTITGLDVTAQKTALVTFTVGSDFPEFKSDASCSSEPQSLIAEYFLNCQPGSAPDPLNGPIAAARNKTTVQPDLVQNTLREPFKRRLQLLINEFGTALVGNSENLNAAIRSGAPALQQLKQVLNILGRQNTTIAELNANSDAIFQQLTDRREDVVHFIDNAGRTAAISAERRDDLSTNFDRLDDFLAELQPTMVQLGKLARYQTPLLTDLHAIAPGLNRLAANLPAFNNGTRLSLNSLGNAAAVGKVALQNSNEEIAALNQSSTKARPAADAVATFLESISDPKNAAEEDNCARYDLREQPGEADRRVRDLNAKLGTTLNGRQDVSCPWSDGSPTPAGDVSGNPGYNGLEGLLNYAYIQTNSLNLFDNLGHALHFTLVQAPGSTPCAEYQSGVEGVPAEAGGTTFNPADYVSCAAILGDKQPGINYEQHNQSNSYNPGDPGFGLFGNLGPYDKSVCPAGSFQKSICDPSMAHAALRGVQPTQTQQQQEQQEKEQQKQIKDVLGTIDPSKLKPEAQKKIQDILNGLPLDQVQGQLQQITEGAGLNSTGSTLDSTTGNVLDFLLGP